jgi:hypothetical protein
MNLSEVRSAVERGDLDAPEIRRRPHPGAEAERLVMASLAATASNVHRLPCQLPPAP